MSEHDEVAPMFWMWRHLNNHVKHVYVRVATNLDAKECDRIAKLEWTEIPGNIRQAVMDDSVHAAVCESKKILEEMGVW